jgi:Icc-related predicted phosphoesterase
MDQGTNHMASNPVSDPMIDQETRVVPRGASILSLAAIADLHCTKASQGKLQALLSGLSGRADVLLLCGDLTDNGTPEEARVLAAEISKVVNIPKLAVLGNHDYETGHEVEVKQILTESGIQVLDGDALVISGVGFVGIKGFAGGFGRRMLEPWGEGSIKQFVADAVNESLKLESALAKLRVSSRVVLMHYAPIEATVRGEPAEIYPFLGCSRLEEPLNRHGVDAVFHGHAHYGAAEGKTRDGIPVYNVAAPLLRRLHPDAPPYRIVGIPRDERWGQDSAEML